MMEAVERQMPLSPEALRQALGLHSGKALPCVLEVPSLLEDPEQLEVNCIAPLPSA